MLHLGLGSCRTFCLALAAAVLMITAMPAVTTAGQLKVAVIKFGTVSWPAAVATGIAAIVRTAAARARQNV